MRVRVFSGLAVVALSVGTLLAGVTLAWSHSNDSLTDQVHACIANVSKVVRIVGVTGKCKTASPKETAIHWPATVTAPAASGGGLRVVDSSMPPKTVGVVIEQGIVVINANGALFTVAFTRDGLLAPNAVALYYEFLDCQGPAFIPEQGLPPAGREENDGSFTYPDVTQTQVRTLRSHTILGGCLNLEVQQDFSAWPAFTFDVASQGWTPPFFVVSP